VCAGLSALPVDGLMVKDLLEFRAAVDSLKVNLAWGGGVGGGTCVWGWGGGGREGGGGARGQPVFGQVGAGWSRVPDSQLPSGTISTAC
jgi:hypothetical protein